MDWTARFEKILTAWGVEAISNWQVLQDNVSRITLVDGRQFVLKQVGPGSEAALRRLRFEHDVLRHVEQQGLAVAVPLLTNTGAPYVLDSDQIYRLSHWLPNQPADVQTNEEQVRLYQNYGAAIGRFHLALASYDEADSLSRTWQTDLRTRIVDQAVPSILTHLGQDRLAAFQVAWSEIEPSLTSAFAGLPTQLIIWDCHPGNVAVNGFEVSGFIDCDNISFAPRIFDLADFLVHQVKWEVGDEQKSANWLAHIQHLLLGYQSVTALSQSEQAALYYALLGIPLIFMDFFFQGGLPELTQVEFDAFMWLVRQRQEIMAQIAKNL